MATLEIGVFINNDGCGFRDFWVVGYDSGFFVVAFDMVGNIAVMRAGLNDGIEIKIIKVSCFIVSVDNEERC